LLAIHSDKATFSEILLAVQKRTGADIAIPAGAEQERVVADIGPGPAQEVLASLLNGSNFNFLILNSANDPRLLDRVILTPRGGGVFVPAPQGPPVTEDAGGGDDPAGDGRSAEPVALYPQPRPDIPPAQAAPVQPNQGQAQPQPEENAPNNQ
jgi:hypothetical protein